MKSFYSLRLFFLATLLSGFSMLTDAQTVTSFGYSGGAVQTFVVPSGCTLISIDMAGAAGGSIGAAGGKGGGITGNIPVTPSSTLYICVGGAGTNFSCCITSPGGISPGGEGGGTGGNNNGGGGGGAASSIRTDISTGATSNTSLLSRLAVAGGGGGAGWKCNQISGGCGANPGQTGGTDVCTSTSGAGGTTSGGGVATYSGFDGAFGVGGNCDNSMDGEGGGGGGGWYGGAGTGSGGGGGGCSYVPSGTFINYTSCYRTGNGYVNITALIPTIIDSPATALAFGGVTIGTASAPQTFWVGGVILSPTSGTLTVTAPFGFLINTGSGFGTTATINYTTQTFPAAGFPVQVEFLPTALSVFSASVTISGGGATTVSLPVSGNGILGCTGTPSPGTASVTPSSGTAGPLSLSLSPAATVGGLTYQWYSWSLGAGTGFTPISGATTANYNYTGAFTNNTYFYCTVTCGFSGLSANSNTTVATYTSATCSGLPAAGTMFTTTPAGCSPSFTATVYDNGVSTATGVVYNWEISTVSATTGFIPITGATNPYYTANFTGTVWLRDSVTCIVGGSRNTTAQMLTLNPAPAAITGSPLICIGTSSAYTTTTTGVTWSTSNTSVVNVGLSTGIATGVAPGFANIIGTITTTGCSTSLPVTVNLGATSIIGATQVCTGSHTTLNDLVSGGVWSSSIPGNASVGASTGVVTGITPGTSSLVYTLASGCSTSLPMVINPLPAAISGTPNACVGQTSVLSDISGGGKWSSSDVFLASIGSNSGIVTGMAAGTATIFYTSNATGCSATQVFTVKSLPAPISGFTGIASACAGQTLALTDGTGTWTSSAPGLATVGASTGMVTGVTGGMPTITYTDAVTGCWVTTPFTVLPTPTPQIVTVSDSGGFCPGGAGVHVGLGSSVAGINYYLFYDGAAFAVDSLPGSSSSLDFGVYSGLGTYSVTAVNTATGCTSLMSGVATVFNNIPPPVNTIGGGGSYCSGATGVDITLDGSYVGVKYQLLYGSTPVGPTINGTGSPLNFGPQTGDVYPYTVEAQNASTLCTSTMSGFAFVYVSINPTIDTLEPGGSYCAGGTGVNLLLNNSTSGIFYRLYNGTTEVDSNYGVTGPLTFPNEKIAGNYIVTATDITNGCHDQMAGVANIAINPLPQQYSLTGGGSFCLGGLGKHIGLDHSVIGTSYSLWNGTTSAFISTVPGGNSALDFGYQTAGGTYYVIGEISATSCSDSMLGTETITVNIPPTKFNVTGGGAYCMGGAGMPVTTDGSDPGSTIKYQLIYDGSPLGAAITTTGSPLNFGLKRGAGNYMVTALNVATLCYDTMMGSVNIVIDSLPHVYTVTGGGPYCAGGTGADIMLANSDVSVTYQLINNGTDTLPGVGGSGGALDFGLQTMAGVYTVFATNSVPCTSNMASHVSVVINPLPTRNLISGGGSYCAGGTGVPVGLYGSNGGIKYQLVNDGVNVGARLSGTGGSINFGLKTDTGHYYVVAQNNATGCMDTMTGVAPITINPNPIVFTVNGGGSFCAGTAGVAVGMDTSEDATVTYKLYDGSTLEGTLSGTTHSFNFPVTNVPGTYTVIAKTAAGCTSTMAGSAGVVAIPDPVVYNVTGGGSYCAGDTGAHIFLSSSNTFVNYQVWNGSTHAGSFWAGTGTTLDLGLYTAAGTYTVSATSQTNGCTSNMNGSSSIVVIPTVAASVTVSAGASETVCSGVNTTFVATGVNGGSSPVYQWKVNGSLLGMGNMFNYVPANGDMVTVTFNSNAVCASPAVSTYTTTVTVLPTGTPSVMVTADTNNVCPGTMVTFHAAPTFGGTAPTYQWKVNGMNVGSLTPTYAYKPNDSDVIFAILTSNYPCPSTSLPVLSNDVIETIDSPRVPVFSISVNPVTPLMYGQNTTLTATVFNAGSSRISYQWTLNNIAISGATTNTYSSSNLKNGDIVCCMVTSSNSTCGSSAPASQCETMVIYGNTGVAQFGNGNTDIRVIPNPNNGSFSINGTLGSLSGGDENVSLEVTNMLGQVVYTNNAVDHNGSIKEQVRLNNLANGMYLLNVRSGSETAVIHFVIGE